MKTRTERKVRSGEVNPLENYAGPTIVLTESMWRDDSFNRAIDMLVRMKTDGLCADDYGGRRLGVLAKEHSGMPVGQVVIYRTGRTGNTIIDKTNGKSLSSLYCVPRGKIQPIHQYREDMCVRKGLENID